MSTADTRERVSRQRQTVKRKVASPLMGKSLAVVHKNGGVAIYKGLICPCKEELLDKIQDIPSNRLIARVMSPGMTVFLYDQELGRLYGVYQAGESEYDDKIILHLQDRCIPLEGMELEKFFLENDLKPHVGPEILTAPQVSRLLDMFIEAKCVEAAYNNAIYAAEQKGHYLQQRLNSYGHYRPYDEDMHIVGDGGYLREHEEPAHIPMSYAPMPPSSAVLHAHAAMSSGWKVPHTDPTMYAAQQMKNQRRLADPEVTTGYQRQDHLARGSGSSFYNSVARMDTGDIKVSSLDGMVGSCGKPGCVCGQPPPFRAHHPAEVYQQPTRPEAAVKGYEEPTVTVAATTSAHGSRKNLAFSQLEGIPKKREHPKPATSKTPKAVHQRQQGGTVVPTGHKRIPKVSRALQQKQSKDKSVFDRIKPATVFSRLAAPLPGRSNELSKETSTLIPQKSFHRPPPPKSTRMTANAKNSVVIKEDNHVSEATEEDALFVDFKRRVVNGNAAAPQLKKRKIIRPDGLGCSSENVTALEAQDGVVSRS